MQPAARNAPSIVVMGVSGSGKSTVAALLAKRLDRPMLEGDSLHSAENVTRMASGIPLSEHDRRDWYAAIGDRLAAAALTHDALVVACSALTRAGRDRLRRDAPRTVFVHLVGTRSLLEDRLRRRRGHFMPPGLLDSQLQTLQPPDPEEHAMTVDIDAPPETLVDGIAAAICACPPWTMKRWS